MRCWGGLHQTFVKALVTTRDGGAAGVPFGPAACAAGGSGLPRIRQLEEVPTRKAGGLLIPRQAAVPREAGPWERSALPKPVPRAGVGGPMGAVAGGRQPRGCDVGPAVPVAMRDPGSPCGAGACVGRERPQELPGGTLRARGGRTRAGATRGPRRFRPWGVSSAHGPGVPPLCGSTSRRASPSTPSLGPALPRHRPHCCVPGAGPGG